jgi:hypothetical protein
VSPPPQPPTPRLCLILHPKVFPPSVRSAELAPWPCFGSPYRAPSTPPPSHRHHAELSGGLLCPRRLATPPCGHRLHRAARSPGDSAHPHFIVMLLRAVYGRGGVSSSVASPRGGGSAHPNSHLHVDPARVTFTRPMQQETFPSPASLSRSVCVTTFVRCLQVDVFNTRSGVKLLRVGDRCMSGVRNVVALSSNQA